MRVIISALLIAGLFACSSQKNKKDITGCWEYTSIANADKFVVKRIALYDKMCLEADSTFHYALKSEMTYATGTWSILDSSLVLNYDYIPSGAGVDSVVISNAGLLNYMLESRPIKRLGLARSMTKDKSFEEIYSEGKNISRQVRMFAIEKWTKDTLQITENDIRFSFIKN